MKQYFSQKKIILTAILFLSGCADSNSVWIEDKFVTVEIANFHKCVRKALSEAPEVSIDNGLSINNNFAVKVVIDGVSIAGEIRLEEKKAHILFSGPSAEEPKDIKARLSPILEINVP